MANNNTTTNLNTIKSSQPLQVSNTNNNIILGIADTIAKLDRSSSQPLLEFNQNTISNKENILLGNNEDMWMTNTSTN